MQGGYYFIGSAFLKEKILAPKNVLVYLPYAGLGYAERLKKNTNWLMDVRLGIGIPVKAFDKALAPIFKIGFGHVF
jgi:hypothetical protein